MTKYGMKVDRNFKVTITEVVETADDCAGERDAEDGTCSCYSKQAGPSNAELQADSVSNEERDLATAEAARILAVHDEAHARFEKECERKGI